MAGDWLAGCDDDDDEMGSEEEMGSSTNRSYDDDFSIVSKVGPSARSSALLCIIYQEN